MARDGHVQTFNGARVDNFPPAYWHVLLDGISTSKVSDLQRGVISYFGRAAQKSVRVVPDERYKGEHAASLFVDPDMPKEHLEGALTHLIGRSYQGTRFEVKGF